MEMVIPPRDHGPPTYRYTWDENGEVTQVTRVLEDGSPLSEPLVAGRRTVQWPFQSVIGTETETSSPTSAHQQQRRATTAQLSGQLPAHSWVSSGSSGEAVASVEREVDGVVPDYVVNFLRGETPESVARRKQSTIIGGGKTGEPQHLDFVAHHQYQSHRSRVADFEGFHYRGDSLSSLGSRASDEAFLPAESSYGGGSGWRFWTEGWRAGIAVNLLLIFVILITGFICLNVGIARSTLSEGRWAIFSGSCSSAVSLDLGLHGAICIFVVALVAGANYVFQVLISPTRDEVAAAHQKAKWLDIGIPSLRNLRRIETSRAFLAVLVLLSAFFTQIMYNAVVFVSQTAPNLKAALIGESFIRGAASSIETSGSNGGLSRLDLLTLQQHAMRGELVRLSGTACFARLSGAFQTDYSAVLLVSNDNLGTSSLVQTSGGANTLLSRPGEPGTTTLANLTIEPSAIQFCLAQPSPAPTCEVNLNAALLGVVALLNSLALVATAAVLFRRRASPFRPLATLGDAISSFLEEPDPTTRGCCLLSKTDVWQGRWPMGHQQQQQPFVPEPKYWVPESSSGHMYWLRAVSFPRWLAAAAVWAACAGLAAAGLAVAVVKDPAARLSPLGVASPHAVVPLAESSMMMMMMRMPASAAAMALVACLPQALLALLYFAVNGVVTGYFLSHESALFAMGPKPLRVSSSLQGGAATSNRGAQVTSLYLTLPRAVSWALMALFLGMAFVLSQSLFVVAVQVVDVDLAAAILQNGSYTSLPSPSDAGGTGVQPPLVGLGLSGVGLLTLLSILVLLAVLVLGLGLRRAPAAGIVNGELTGNPMALPAGSCSAVISARCHPLAREKGLQKKPVMWGVVREGVGMAPSHCGFTAGRAGMVSAGRSYS